LYRRLSNVIRKLTRNEMKSVMAGSGSSSPNCADEAAAEANEVERQYEEAKLGCLTSSGYNAVYNTAYDDCVAAGGIR
jgi:hypothetical protein